MVSVLNSFILKTRFLRVPIQSSRLKIYPPEDGVCNIIVIYEVDDVAILPDNGKYLSIDLGLHNLMTCYNSQDNSTFIVGRKYLSICNYYYKEIARVQSQWYSLQNRKGVKYPKTSKHIQKLYTRKTNSINDYLHKVTRYIAEYCHSHNINTVIIGDITNIRKDNNLGNVNNQKLHSLPYAKIYTMLEYKLALYGIRFVKQNEAYSSQTSPLKDVVSKKNAVKANRVKRGLYRDEGHAWNADCVGAFNILRLYFMSIKKNMVLNPLLIKSPTVIKVAV
jgi:putative transposase